MDLECNAGVPGILSHHLAELRKSGLTDATIQAAGIRSETNYLALATLLNWRKLSKRMAPAMVFPFRRPDGSNGYCRLKFDNPRKIGGKPIKYESPKGQPNEFYLPPGVADVLQRPDAELLITEGEKKSLAATQAGFACIGLVGVYGWKDGKSERLLPALERVAWNGRPVRIVFDSDAAENPQVADAEKRLAKHLADHGAVVRVARLPAIADADGKPVKVGLDDFLVIHDSAALRKLLDEAQEAESLSAAECKEQASKLDPGDEAKACLESSRQDGVFRLRFWRGSWWQWRIGSYRGWEPAEVRGVVIRRLDLRFHSLGTAITNNVMDHLKAHAMLGGDVDPPAWIDPRPADWPADEVLATRGKLLHLQSLVVGRNCLMEATPRFFTPAALDFDFDPSAPPAVAWLEFLGQLWPDDPPSVATLQEWIGYLLTVDTRQQKILLLIGPKRSGKGTIARVVRELVGRGNVGGPTLASLATNFGLWPLLGRSVAIISDARLGHRSDQAVIVERLLSISGEDALTVDRKFLDPVTCKLPTRLMIVSNELPRLSDASGALASRFIVLRLTESFFGREDPKLTSKLLAELPGILLWAIEGWRRLRERGRFIQPDAGGELLGQLHDLTSPVGAFVREQCNVGLQYQVSVQALFGAWQAWCNVAGRKEPGTEANFGRELSAAVPTLRRVRPRENGDRHRAYEGIALKIAD